MSNINKSYILCLLASWLLVITTMAQPFESRTYTTGNYIFCGKDIPKNFAYIIEKRRDKKSNWERVAFLTTAASLQDCQAMFMKLPPSIAYVNRISQANIDFFFKKLTVANKVDSLYSYAYNPIYLHASGVAFFDEEKEQAAVTYRISKLEKGSSPLLINEFTLNAQPKNYMGMLKHQSHTINKNSNDIYYTIGDTINTLGIKVFRTEYGKNQFKEIVPTIMYMHKNKQLVAYVNDASVVQGMAYTYTAIPFDYFGNMGIAADTVNLYHLSKQADMGIVPYFKAIPHKEKQGNQLIWKLQNGMHLVSIEVFRSTNYDSLYEHIATLSPNDTMFFDNKIQPAKAYYYYVTFTNGFGSSIRSARTPAILEGIKQSVIPPQNLQLIRKGRLVTLSFEKAENDTRGYYIYRANGYLNELKQISGVILSTADKTSYTDTLPLTNQPQVYSYAVASVNTSFNVSQFTDRVSTSYSGGQLPTVYNVKVIPQKNQLIITWPNLADNHAAVVNYRIYRTVKEDTNVIEKEHLLAILDSKKNSFTDDKVEDGITYCYQVQAQGFDSTDLGNKSSIISYTTPNVLPLPPGKLTLIPSDNKMLLKWTLPMDERASKLRIYRSELNKEPQMLTELSKVTAYEDSAVEKGKYYFYFIVSIDAKGRESKRTDMVSGKLEK